MLDSIEPADVLRHDIYRLPPLDTFVTRRVALLGDAAHAMTPDFGQGGGTSIEDAVELGRQLATADLAGGLTRYDRLRRPRTQTIARQSARFGALAQASTPVTARLRDAAARLLPQAVLLNAVKPMLSWGG
jgi:2-polyprenyl-6-methoxyphenol hydroxylase-like FAD-dependent oxidoreductase